MVFGYYRNNSLESVEKDENTQDKYKMIEAKVGFHFEGRCASDEEAMEREALEIKTK